MQCTHVRCKNAVQLKFFCSTPVRGNMQPVEEFVPLLPLAVKTVFGVTHASPMQDAAKAKF